MSLQKKSFTIGNHRTSISLEPEFWDALELKANEQDVSLSKLVLKIDNEKPKDYNNLASYISCLLYTSPSPRDKRQSRMPSSA